MIGFPVYTQAFDKNFKYHKSCDIVSELEERVNWKSLKATLNRTRGE